MQAWERGQSTLIDKRGPSGVRYLPHSLEFSFSDNPNFFYVEHLLHGSRVRFHSSRRKVLAYPGINFYQANATKHLLCEPRSRVCDPHAFPSLGNHYFDYNALDREADDKDCECNETRGAHVIDKETKSNEDLFERLDGVELDESI